MATVKYQLSKAHLQKLRSLKRELDTFNQSFINAWANQHWEAAAVALRQANLAEANLRAYQVRLIDMQRNGIKTTGYVK